MQAIFLQIAVEFPVVVAPNVHPREHNTEHALVEAMVALIRPIRRNALATTDAVNHLQRNETAALGASDSLLDETDLGKNFLRNARAGSITLRDKLSAAP
jgi:hypothetical protein